MYSLLNPHIAFVDEPESAALDRYSGFAVDLFPRLYASLPKLRGRFKFYRHPQQTTDLWSICEISSVSFGLQLDPDIEIICLWNGVYQEEIGNRPPDIIDPVEHAIKRIQECYLHGK